MEQIFPAIRYRAATFGDLPTVVQIHLTAFPTFFMTQLGPNFLTYYYKLVLDDPWRIFIVAENSIAVLGFVSGTLHPQRFYQQLRKHRWCLITKVIIALLREPLLLTRLIASYARAGHTADSFHNETCELTSLAVNPTCAGHGIGKGLVTTFIGLVRGKRQKITLTTETTNNEKVNAFYHNLGFRIEESFYASKGRKLNKYFLRI